jgi:biopolymer transport protein ExbB
MQEVSLMQIFTVIGKGGLIMYPIVASSIIFLAVFIERWYVLRHSKERIKRYLRALRKAINQRDLRNIVDISQKNPGPASRIIMAGIKKYLNGVPREAKEAMEAVAMQEFPYFEKRLGVLSTIASVAPLLGLLGTVTGMIRTFNVIASIGVGKPTEMAGGISEALITTAAGLSVAIPTVIGHYYLSQIAESIMNDIEKASSEVLDIIEELRINNGNEGVIFEETKSPEGVEENVPISTKETEAPA